MSVGLIVGEAGHLPLADESVQCVITSPPYWALRDYGVAGQVGHEETVDAYVERLACIAREIWRVLRNDGTMWLVLGDSYNAAGRKGHGTREGYKQGTNRASRDGLDTRRSTDPVLRPKSLLGVPWRVAFALMADGWVNRAEVIWAKPNPMPESVKDRPSRAHEQVFLFTKSERYYYDAKAVAEPLAASSLQRLGQDTFHAQVGGSKDYGSSMRSTRPQSRHRSARRAVENLERRLAEGDATRNRRTVWTIAAQSYRGAHFATFPPALVLPCLLAGPRPGDVVLDPFSGSGTVGEVAVEHGRDAVLVDLRRDYHDLAAERLYRMTPLYVRDEPQEGAML